MSLWTTIVELQNEIPSTNIVVAIILLLLNIFFPGLGTAVMSLLNGFKPKTLLVALLQFLLTIILIGWIWSIWWGILCVTKSV